MRVTVRYFAVVRERLGVEEDGFDLPDGAGLATLRAAMMERRPALRDMLPHVRVAVDQEFAAGDAPLADGAEVALIPPVSGGSGGSALFRVQEAPLAVEEAIFAVAHGGAGAVDVFVGTVRGTNRGREVVALEYEAYAAMASAVLDEIAEQAEARWPQCAVAVVHRVGLVPIGEAAVAIVAAAPHRSEAYEANRFVIEGIKDRLPIWKRERFLDGSEWKRPGA